MATFCKKCGNAIPDGSAFCSNCGTPVARVEGASTALKIVSLLFPVVGWVLYFVFKDENITKARDCSKFAWIGFGISFLIGFIGGLAG